MTKDGSFHGGLFDHDVRGRAGINSINIGGNVSGFEEDIDPALVERVW
jgi:hypothetical protein